MSVPARMLRVAALTAFAVGALGLAPGAAGAGPIVLRSADGLLTLTIPAGAVPVGTAVRIRAVPSATLPAALRARAVSGPVYELEPAGLRFAKPVAVTRSVRGAVRGGIPALVLLGRTTAGRWARAAAQAVRWDPRGGSLTVSAQTTRASTLAVLDDGVRLSLSPARVSRIVGGAFTATVRVAAPDPSLVEAGGVAFSPTLQTVPGRVRALVPKAAYATSYTCRRTGTTEYAVRLTLKDSTPERVLRGLLSPGRRDAAVELKAWATCAAPPNPHLAAACVTVTHSPIGTFPSFLDFVLLFDPGTLPAHPTVSLQAAGVNDDLPVYGPVDTATGRAYLIAGIRGSGAYHVDHVTLNERAVDVSKTFGKFTVTAEPGTVAGTCP